MRYPVESNGKKPVESQHKGERTVPHLVIRDTQFRALERAARQRAVDRAVRELRVARPETIGGRPVEEVRREVDIAWKRAQGYGLRTRRDLTSFAELALVVSPHFDRHPAFAEILEDPDTSPDRRLEELFVRATPEDWLAAAELP